MDHLRAPFAEAGRKHRRGGIAHAKLVELVILHRSVGGDALAHGERVATPIDNLVGGDAGERRDVADTGLAIHVSPEVACIRAGVRQLALPVPIAQVDGAIAEQGVCPAKVGGLGIGVREAVRRHRRVVGLRRDVIHQDVHLPCDPGPEAGRRVGVSHCTSHHALKIAPMVLGDRIVMLVCHGAIVAQDQTLRDVLDLGPVEAQVVVRVPLVNHTVLESVPDSIAEADQRRCYFGRGMVDQEEDELLGCVAVAGIEHCCEAVRPRRRERRAQVRVHLLPEEVITVGRRLAVGGRAPQAGCSAVARGSRVALRQRITSQSAPLAIAIECAEQANVKVHHPDVGETIGCDVAKRRVNLERVPHVLRSQHLGRLVSRARGEEGYLVAAIAGFESSDRTIGKAEAVLFSSRVVSIEVGEDPVTVLDALDRE